jgi:uncharacterized membrane protein
MNSSTVHTGIASDPLLALPWLIGLSLLVGLVWLVASWRGMRAPVSRGLALLALLVALWNPSVVREVREALPAIVAVIVDRSESMALSGRTDGATAAARRIEQLLAARPGLDVRRVEVADTPEGTRLSTTLETVFADAPAGRIAGAILISDGQIVEDSELRQPWPLHQVLVGRPNERDRRLEIVSAPRTGPVGGSVRLQVKVEDNGGGEAIPLRVTVPGQTDQTVSVMPGETVAIDIPLAQRGSVPVALEAAVASGEISNANNARVLTVNAVRDRLRVMLVTGAPHAGARAWRNLLKADPSVDLVHFTILRSSDRMDFTPVEEMSLIPFPVDELFLEKIDGFDLVVFDRFQQLAELSPIYLDSVASWVEQGGALLVLAGPAESEGNGLSETPLARIMPIVPSGKPVTEPFKPVVSSTGANHPVTAPLVEGQAAWGRWLRAEGSTARGQVLLEGGGQPLLVISTVHDGRVAALMSDQAWLWQRGYDGGGPFAELFRRTAHWLMREPDLEGETLKLTGSRTGVSIERRTTVTPASVQLEGLGETPVSVTLTPQGQGRYSGQASARRVGLVRASGDGLSAFAIAGIANPAEADFLVADSGPIARASRNGGGSAFVGRDGRGALPQLRDIGLTGARAGDGWFGLRRSDASVTTALMGSPLIPGWLFALVIGLASLFAWWREGR